MATSISPVTIDLSSDSEQGEIGTSQTYSSQDDVFTVDWSENDFPQSAYDLVDVNEPNVEEKDDASISSADTEIYTPEVNNEITCEDTPIKERNTQEVGKTVKKTAKEKEKALKDQQRLEKKKQREEKKAEEQKQKRIRAALLQQQRNLKPEENIKLLRVNIDNQVVNSEFGGVVIASLQSAGIQYDVGALTQGNTISWTKTVRDIIVSDEGVIQEDVGFKEETELFYLINAEKIVRLIQSNELLTHVQTIRSVYDDKKLTVVIIKMQNYFEAEKRRINKMISDARKGKRNEGHVKITMEDVQYALVELQIIGKCSHWFAETGEELASLITSTTKSLSQLDYKREKQKQQEGELDWYAKADSKQCVKVDKSGNGLTKLWQQQICQFNAVGIETANAITSHYPSPKALIDKYKSCSSVSEGEQLLQNIQMRRDAGILSSTRRLGPEISKKMYHFYMSDDPDLEL